MSSQLEFIMQLYMMNLLQQQQQQQLQQQQQQQQQQQYLLSSPVKAKELQQTQQNLRTLNRKNSENTICSSSRSCSPNSNLSPLPNTSTTSPSLTNISATNPTFPQTPQNLYNPLLTSALTAQSQPMTQMLLNNLPPLTQFMLMQQQQQQQHQQQQHQQQQITSSNILLTPTTPNSSTSPSCFSTPLMAADSCVKASTQTSLNMADYLANNSMSLVNTSAAAKTTNSVHCVASSASSTSATSLFFPSAFTAQNIGSNTQSINFLQSSTVTSTPCSDEKPINAAADVSLEAPVSSAQDDEDDVQILKTEAVETNSLEDDAQVFSSLHSSSANSGSTTSNSKLMCSGVMALETTSDSMEDSTQMPYTPEKSLNPSLVPHKNTIEEDNSNVTPVTLKNAILTPPSSEQLSSNNGVTFEASTIVQTSSTTTSTTTTTSASGVDSFLTEENLKHLRKNSSYLECENSLCRQENLREHFHCYEEPCQGKILSKKDDIIRHLKWHKKRKESLLLGFARFSSSDDCAPEYGAGCAYNWKQTHYHCIYEDCPKVYVSTSDVQMHANFHRKNSEIVQEGFRRFRAHENCKIEDCPFYGKKTSHYHCCREGCNHTFKNKADMDKHKTYHMKDHQLIQDGFKKILKTEQCPFEDCKFSTVSNHIHCVREGCNFILHSSTQMISHKRKHDREGELNGQPSKRDSSEEESPKPLAKAAIKPETRSSTSSSTSTPLSSLSAEHFLARKRGRPPKKIQLPSETQDSKRIKLETSNEQNITSNPATLSMINPFMANFNNPGNGPAAALDANAPNLQLTHLMALFQLQNPLFYQNLYPGGMAAANMANILGNAAVNAAIPNSTNANSNVKQEFNDKSEFKE